MSTTLLMKMNNTLLLYENAEYENKLIFNRHTGDLYFSRKKDKNDSPADTATYKCEKSKN